MEQLWYKNAVFYSLDVETFFDGNGDGIGDFTGLNEKLDYLAGLGITCIWLLPFYPSPNRDNGYDVTDYYNVDARLGNLGDFAQFLNKAEQLGLRVIIDLVINHTSVEHPWFKEAATNRNSAYRNYYIWSDTPLDYPKERLILKGEENTVWHYHEEAGQYYLHRFYKEQPDLNISNPDVRNEIIKIIDFWLRLGVNGFRMDAAEMLVEPYGLKNTDRNELAGFINYIRDYIQWRQKDALLLAEVNADPAGMSDFIHSGERMHMLFNFFLNQHIFLSLATGIQSYLSSALEKLPALDLTGTWLNFLRHHDELNLKLLKEEYQKQVFEAFAPDQRMHLYGFGIRRRLAPMMAGNLDRMKLAYSLLFSMPGVPMIRYGDETGMGDNLDLDGRTSVRTPMQWAPVINGGFSTASPQRLVYPVIDNGQFGYEQVNVLSLQNNPESILSWIHQLIRLRKQCPEAGYGQLNFYPSPDERIMIHGFEWEERKIIFLHNLSDQAISISRQHISHHDARLFTLFAGGVKNEAGDVISLNGYGFLWLKSYKNNIK